MIQFQAFTDQIKEWFPETYDSFIEELRSSKSRYKDTSEDKISWFFSWAPFVKKAENKEDFEDLKESYLNKMSLTYEERVSVELPIIKCSLSMKAGQYYRTDRILEEKMPEFVIDLIKELLKVTMMREQSYFNIPRVVDSLMEFENMIIDDANINSDDLDMDSILDKINESGIKSLTSSELKYLEKMSKS